MKIKEELLRMNRRELLEEYETRIAENTIQKIHGIYDDDEYEIRGYLLNEIEKEKTQNDE